MQFVNAEKGPVLRNNKYIHKYITSGGKMPVVYPLSVAVQEFFTEAAKTFFIRSREFIRALEDPQRQFN